ncbi:AcrR family transcriptional regulator [Nocardioides thalensis]|uniref:AcrR family transcriptional regulator n=1 Tax=Nocardioides thalensis TaxID=1914755 RepID=A0A853CBH7_9ACTN|nr:AcrR family transcriptional regulator [Nocardioides thalensis]
MGRPPKHSADDFIDAAIALYAEGGIRTVTLGAVAESIGAANGSIYHRFPDRPSLLAAVWLRTSDRFASGYRETLGEPSADSAVDAAVWVVEWCRAHVAEAQVLQAGARALGRDEWPPEARAADTTDKHLRRDIGRIVAQVQASSGANADQIVFAMLELPLAVVRRSLQAGKPPGRREVELVRGLARLILTQPAS